MFRLKLNQLAEAKNDFDEGWNCLLDITMADVPIQNEVHRKATTNVAL